MKRSPGAINRQGFTLLEVLVAVVILGLAYVAILQNFSASARNIGRVEKSRAATLAAVVRFESALQDSGDESGANPTQEVFLEGSKYWLVFFPSEDGEMETLKLEKR